MEQGQVIVSLGVMKLMKKNGIGVGAQYYNKAVSPYRHFYLVQTVRCWLDGGSSTDRSFLLAMPKRPHTNRIESNCVEPRFAKGAVRVYP